MLSKRLLIQLVEGGHVDGWDDPRMPTLAGARRRGYTPEGFRKFAERVGVAKENSWIDYSVLEDCMREHLNEIAPRRMAVLDPIKLVIENYPEGQEEMMEVPNHPKNKEMGTRQVPFSRELWIERDDYTDTPAKGYFRLAPGAMVRLRYGYVVKCEGMRDGIVRCTYLPETRSGTPGADTVKVKGNIHWVSAKHAHEAEVRLYDRLFKTEKPEDQDDLNPDSIRKIRAWLEPSLNKTGKDAVQFERHGYFCSDRSGFNRTVGLHTSFFGGAFFGGGFFQSNERK
jgi:glutaminyl-tRNA synthetase